MKVYAIIPAAGVGSRMQAEQPKQYLPLLGRTVAEHTLHTLIHHPKVEAVVVGVAKDDPYWPQLPQTAQVISVEGGQTRAQTVLKGLEYLSKLAAPEDWVLVHDMARPCLHATDIDALLACSHPEGAILGVPVADTLKKLEGHHIKATVDRAQVWRAFTPQFFPIQLLYQALRAALAAGVEITDEASAVEWFGGNPRMIHGRGDNIKITWPEDLALAEFYLQQQARER